MASLFRSAILGLAVAVFLLECRWPRRCRWFLGVILWPLNRCNPKLIERHSKNSPSSARRTVRASVWKKRSLPQSLLLDITGIAHLFGGEFLLIHRLQKELIAKHLRCGLPSAILSERLGRPLIIWPMSAKPVIIPSRAIRCFVGSCRWKGCGLANPSLQKLHRLGNPNDSPDSSASTRSSLPSRFGGEINLRLDQFTGERPEPIIPCRPPPKFQVEHFLEDGTSSPKSSNNGGRMLLERLVGLLQQKQMGTRHLQCAFITEQKTKHDITIRLCEATADARHLGDLLRLQHGAASV